MARDNVIVTVHKTGHAEEVQLTGQGSTRPELVDELDRRVAAMRDVVADTIVQVVREAVHNGNYEQLAVVSRNLEGTELNNRPMGELRGVALEGEPPAHEKYEAH